MYAFFSKRSIAEPKKYVFFDRDGTLIHHIHHLSDLSQVHIFEDAYETLNELSEMGLRLCIVTNQSIIGQRFGNFFTSQ